MSLKYSKLQWFTLFVYCFVSTLCGFTISLQGPFYPLVAESKGATPVQYGFVFGVFSFVLFIFSPFAGYLMSKFGSVRVILCGLFTIGSTNVIFGFVDKLSKSSLFIGASVVIRIFEGAGYVMVRSTSLAVIISEFPENIEMSFTVIQTSFTFGILIGPVAGGALFEFGGFLLPFLVTGVLLLSTAFVVFFLSNKHSKRETTTMKEILMVLRIPCVILGIFTVFGALVSCGFVLSVIAPHLKKIDFSPLEVGLMILVHALANAISSIICSKLCKKYDSALYIICFSSFMFVGGFLFLGPAPYFPFDLNVYTSLFGTILLGIGIGGEQVAGFSILNKGALIVGLPQNINTYELVSSMFTSSLFLGNFIGPILGGYLYELFGFGWGSHFFILYNVIICLVTLICIYLWRNSPEFHECNKLLPSSKNPSKYNTHE